MKRILSILMTITLLASQSFAQVNRLTIESDDQRISEYFYSKTGHDVLEPIKIMGQINKPGMYHVPKNTTLATLITIAGGTQREADLSQVFISKPKQNVSKTNLSELLDTGQDLTLSGGELVYISEKKYFFDSQTVGAVTVITSLLSVFMTAYLVSRQNH